MRAKRLKYALLNRVFAWASPMLGFMEARAIRRWGNKPLQHQPVFIVGAPRTGSTILFQAITNSYDVLYTDNLTHSAWRNFYAGSWLSAFIFGRKPHNCFRSHHGDTTAYGLHAPSENWLFWQRWFDTTCHFADSNALNDNHIEELRLNISAVINRFNKPMAIKNLGNGQRLRILAKAFPHAKIIYCTRDTLFTAQSIYFAMQNQPKDKVWGIRPACYKALEGLTQTEMIVGQIHALEQQIEQDLTRFENAPLVVSYQSLCKDWQQTLHATSRFIAADLPPRAHARTPEIKLSEKMKLPEDIKADFEKAINKLSWQTPIHNAS